MIHLRKFDLEALDLSKKEHFILVSKLSEEEYTKKYISKKFSDFVKEPDNKERFETGKTYLVKNGEKIVGLIGTKEMDAKGYLEPWILISPENRSKKYGTKILEQLTPYLIENVDKLQDIKFVINKSNFASKKIAENLGFVKKPEESTYDDEVYRYFGM